MGDLCLTFHLRDLDLTKLHALSNITCPSCASSDIFSNSRLLELSSVMVSTAEVCVISTSPISMDDFFSSLLKYVISFSIMHELTSRFEHLLFSFFSSVSSTLVYSLVWTWDKEFNFVYWMLTNRIIFLVRWSKSESNWWIEKKNWMFFVRR